MNNNSNLPPGVTDRMIDEQFGEEDDREYCPDCGNPVDDHEEGCPAIEDDEDDIDEEFFHYRDTESESYRHSMIDAGRGHLLR